MPHEMFKPLANKPSKPSADGPQFEKEMSAGEGRIERIRELVDRIKAAYNYKTKPQEDGGPIKTQLDPEVASFVTELKEEILALPKRLKNHDSILYALKDGDVTELDRLIPSYYELFPGKRNPSTEL